MSLLTIALCQVLLTFSVEGEGPVRFGFPLRPADLQRSAAAAWWGLDPAGQAVVLIGFVILVGYNANDWRRGGLARRGYLLADVVAGRDLAAAEQRFFDHVSATAP